MLVTILIFLPLKFFSAFFKIPRLLCFVFNLLHSAIDVNCYLHEFQLFILFQVFISLQLHSLK